MLSAARLAEAYQWGGEINGVGGHMQDTLGVRAAMQAHDRWARCCKQPNRCWSSLSRAFTTPLLQFIVGALQPYKFSGL